MTTHSSREMRREQILNAAQSCFGKTGYHKTRMDDIVRAAGLSKGALYWHFKSKDEIFFDRFDREIFAAIYKESRARLQATLEAGIRCGEIAPCEARHVAAMLTAMIEGLLLQALADPDFDAMGAWPTSWEIISRGLTSGAE